MHHSRIAVAPVLALAADHRGRTVCSRVLRGSQTVQRVVGKSLGAVRVFVIRNTKNISVIASSKMKIIANIENSLAGSIGRHVHWLQALVVTERTGNPGKRRAVAADKTS